LPSAGDPPAVGRAPRLPPLFHLGIELFLISKQALRWVDPGKLAISNTNKMSWCRLFTGANHG